MVTATSGPTRSELSVGGVTVPAGTGEWRVVLMVAAVAEHLTLGVETVHTHVVAVLRKLGARDRTHAVVIAYPHGLVPLRPSPPVPPSPPLPTGR